MSDAAPDFDVLVVGAGISGISMAAHLKTMCQDLRFVVLERRQNIGGTWDLFRYPGVRSDSDMHSLGFRFEPWKEAEAIAGGDAIRDYLGRVARERGIDHHIRCGTKVIAADFIRGEARWSVAVEDSEGRRTLSARFLYLASGYYDYDAPHDAKLPDIERFEGRVVHPQFWPRDLDYAGKRVVVVGSGATAVTIVPAMADDARHVTMLQRTPTWMAAGPSKDAFANAMRRWLPEKLAYWVTRQKNIRLHSWFFRRARNEPDRVAPYLSNGLRKQLGEHYDPGHFEPPYGPWEQRLCLVPDGDLFDSIKRGRAAVITDHIESFEQGGIRLASGEFLPADIVVTATGLKLSLGGKVAVSVDGVPVDWADHWFYRSCMFSNVPNLAVVFGYLNASWTLRADNTADFTCRVLKHMTEIGTDTVVAELAEDHSLQEDDIVLFSSGYLQRAKSLMPKSAATLPWRLNMDYLEDCRDLRQNPVSDGVLRFTQAVAKSGELA